MSRAAHKSLSDQERETIRGLILDEFDRAGEKGLTCDQVEDALSMPHQTISARITEMKKNRTLTVKMNGAIGERRPTRTTRSAWVLVRVK